MRLRLAKLLLVGIALVPLAATISTAQPAPAPDPEPADPSVLVGTVLLDDVPIGGVPLALHRVTPDQSGEAASTVSASDGRFRFDLAVDPAASFTAFFVTAEYLSVRYFGPPIHGDSLPAAYSVVVYDTASILPESIRIPRRDVVLAPLADGSWEVNEMVRVANPNEVALVAEAGMPTWELVIPDAATDFEAGEGDILPHEVARMENRVMLLTPLPPGARDLYIRYRIPPRPTRATITVSEATDTINLFVEQPSHLNEVIGLQSTTMLTVEGLDYLQYSGADFEPGSTVEVAWSGALAPPIDPVIAAVVVTLLLLVVGAFAAFRDRPATPTL